MKINLFAARLGLPLFATAVSICSVLAQADERPTTAQITEVTTHLPPPYSLKLSSLAELVYVVSSHRLQTALDSSHGGPSPFRVEGIKDLSLLTVLIAHYSEAKASNGNISVPYDEIGYLTQVSYGDQKGSYYFKLQLDPGAVDAWVLGRGYYGYPKELQNVTITSGSSSLSVQASDQNTGAPIANIEATFVDQIARDLDELDILTLGQIPGDLSAIVKGLSLFEGWASGKYLGAFSTIFTDEDSQLRSVKFDATASPRSAHLLHVHNSSLPYAVTAELLPAFEVNHPAAALYFDSAEMTLQDRVVLSAPTP